MAPVSPFAPFLHTNYMPSDAELVQINLIVTKAESKLSKLVKGQPSKSLFGKRDALQDFINSHRALTSPIRRLPFDIIRSIFLLCRPMETDRIMKATDAPILLHMCVIIGDPLR
jgi:hypothetical protein